MTNNKIKIGDEVGWIWGYGLATGTVIEISYCKKQISSKSSLITRNGTAADPALTIVHSNGNLVLKLSHEIQKLND